MKAIVILLVISVFLVSSVAFAEMSILVPGETNRGFMPIINGPTPYLQEGFWGETPEVQKINLGQDLEGRLLEIRMSQTCA